MQWFDSHNHLQDSRLGGDTYKIVQFQRDSGISGCVVNATCEADWPQVAKLADEFPDFIRPAFGIHPWKSHTTTPGWQDRLHKLLDHFPSASIGECGIDSWISTPSLAIQTPVFLDHLTIARERQCPLTIHCLKAWGHLFDCLEKELPPPHFLMHSFGGSIEVANRLIPLGAYFSLSGYALQPRKQKTLHVFEQLPPDRVLVETDAPDMLPPPGAIAFPLPEQQNHPANLAKIGSAIASHFKLPPADFATSTQSNAMKWLGET